MGTFRVFATRFTMKKLFFLALGLAMTVRLASCIVVGTATVGFFNSLPGSASTILNVLTGLMEAGHQQKDFEPSRNQCRSSSGR
jgi:hypothetical protein